MKKLMYLELGVMAILLIAAIIVCSYVTSPAFSPDDLYTGSSNVGFGGNPLELIPSWKTYPADRQIISQQYFVYDCRAKAFLTISGQEDDRIYPADATKLFAACIIMQHLQPDTVYTAGDALDLVTPGSAVAQIKKGDTLTGQQLLDAILLPGGSDATYVLAYETGKVIAKDPTLGTVEAIQAFVNEMNTYAKKLGMNNTNFTNPDGAHDENHYTTFKDLAILGSVCMENNTIMRNTSSAKNTITLHGEAITWKNPNALVDRDSPYYCRYATGLTAYQASDGNHSLLASFRRSGDFLLIGAFGCSGETDRFDDALQLFNEVVLK